MKGNNDEVVGEAELREIMVNSCHSATCPFTMQGRKWTMMIILKAEINTRLFSTQYINIVMPTSLEKSMPKLIESMKMSPFSFTEALQHIVQTSHSNVARTVGIII